MAERDRGTDRGAVLVTGTSTGIGRAAAERLAGGGFRVFAGVRNESDAEGLRAEGSDRLEPLMLDVTDASAIAQASERVDRELGDEPLAGLVNNAGVAVGGPLELLDVEDLRWQFEVNSVAPIAVTQAFIPRLRAGRGRVVMMSSVGGRTAQPYVGPYSASKYALEALSDVLRRELLPWGIHVALVEPGTIKTRIWEKGSSQLEEIRSSGDEEGLRRYEGPMERAEKILDMAAKRGAPPEKVVKVVVHALTSDRPRTRYVVGADARMQLAIQAALPTRAVDRLLSRLTGAR
jgi:NAD(P)-dependent dehydrogenase (short-subunit alcohol dehydrogenase family)